jgi:hypothetical protein
MFVVTFLQLNLNSLYPDAITPFNFAVFYCIVYGRGLSTLIMPDRTHKHPSMKSIIPVLLRTNVPYFAWQLLSLVTYVNA